MALQYINGELHEVEKCTHLNPNISCSKCGCLPGIRWEISKCIANSIFHKRVAIYCYTCSRNNWRTAFRLYREAIAASTKGGEA